MSPRTEEALGTICTINLFDQGSEELYRRLFGRLSEIEGIFSPHLEGSDTARLNLGAGLEPVELSSSFIYVLDKALDYAELSGGAFNPALGPLIKLWDIGGEARIPSIFEIEEALELSNYRELEIYPQAMLLRRGMALDLGAIVKGYALDELRKILIEEEIDRAILDLGGDVYVHGARPSGDPWRVGLQDPREGLGGYLGIINAQDASIATSGTYQRYFEIEGRRYHHLLSPFTGYPVENGLMSVTVISRSGIEADALATAAFVLGWEEGRALIARSEGALGIFVFDDETLRLVGEAQDVEFELIAGEYRLAE